MLPDSAVVIFASDDDFVFGVLQSRAHTLWSLATGTQLRERESGFRYTHTECFEKFPFPRPNETQRELIRESARELVSSRQAWFNRVDSRSTHGRGEATLTNLYNQYPDWLRKAHENLNRAVFAAYGWPEDTAELADDEILDRLLKLNLDRASEAT